jgi:APA family basic amino acid/polyamine antiporter
LTVGSREVPTWTPRNSTDEFPWTKIIENQFWIAFAFTGWNAAVYAAGEFRNPRRDVPRAMILGLAVVSILYLTINWIFVANLTPEQAAVVFTYEETRITLAHLIAQGILGHIGGQVVSIFVILAFLSAISAMMMVGPRVYAAMARDGYLPKIFCADANKPPLSATLLQAAVALLLLLSHSLRETVLASAAFLLVFTGLTSASLFRLRQCTRASPPSSYQLAAAALFSLAVASILYTALQTSTTQWYSLGAVVGIATVAYVWTQFLRRREQVGPT